MKKIFVILTLAVLLIGNTDKAIAHSLKAKNIKSINIQWQDKGIKEELKKSILQEISQQVGNGLTGNSFIVYDLLNYDENWVTANIIIKDAPSLVNKSVLDEGGEDSRSALVAVKRNNEWEVRVESHPDYLLFIEEIPNRVLSPQFKISKEKYLIKKYKQTNLFPSSLSSAMTRLQTVNYRFPWTQGESWMLSPARSNMWHGSGCNGKCALDFLPPDPYQGAKIKSATSGLVTRLCYDNKQNTQNVFVLDNDGNEVGYWHISRNTLKVGVNQRIEQGQEIGTTFVYTLGGTYSDNCGVLNTTHLHWMLPYTAASGSIPESTPDIIIDGWNFKYPNNYAVNADSTKKPGDSFTSSNGGCFKTGINTLLVDQSCSLTKNHVELNNITITNNSTLIINDGVTLDLDLRNFFLKVDQGSKIIIKPTGSIQ